MELNKDKMHKLEDENIELSRSNIKLSQDYQEYKVQTL